MEQALSTVNPFSKHVAAVIAKSKDVLFLGYGLGEAVA
jgi:hypothetical protein